MCACKATRQPQILMMMMGEFIILLSIGNNCLQLLRIDFLFSRNNGVHLRQINLLQ